jgi:hypothetical protein
MGGLRRRYVFDVADIPENWRDDFASLWEEDDVHPPGAENSADALSRISGRRDPAIYIFDDGDSVVHFYRGGWVRIVSAQGDSVGVLVVRR